MTQNEVYSFLTTQAPASRGVLDGAHEAYQGSYGTYTPTPGAKPTLREAWVVYNNALAPKHRMQLLFVDRLADFAEVMRGIRKASFYTDEDWIQFILSLNI